MTQYSLVSDLTGGVIQFAFFAGIIFPVIYGPILKYRWWETVPGRVVFSFGPCVSGALLRSALAVWGVQVVQVGPDPARITLGWLGWILSWLSLVCIFGAGVALLVLAWESIRVTVAQRDAPPSPLVNKLLLLHDKRVVLSAFHWPHRK